MYRMTTDDLGMHWSTPWKHVFDVTSIVQRSSPWTCYSVKVEMKFRLECKLHFPCATNALNETIWFLALTSVNTIKIKSALKSSSYAVTADSKSRWPHGKKVFFRGVGFSDPTKCVWRHILVSGCWPRCQFNTPLNTVIIFADCEIGLGWSAKCLFRVHPYIPYQFWLAK